MKVIAVFFLASCLIHQSTGYSRGAPDSACSSMLPAGHGVNSQMSHSPYTITPLQTSIGQGEVITLKLEAANPTQGFKGFFIQAHNPNSNFSALLGTFTNLSPNTKTINCSPGLQNTLTHVKNNPKTSMNFTWQAPLDYQGDVLFRCTFVKDFDEFWTRVPATKLVRVGRSEASYPFTVTPAYQPTTTHNQDFSFSYTPPTGMSASTHAVSTSPVVSPLPWNSPKPISSVYMGCGEVKGCFGLQDSSCIKDGSCSSLVTYTLKDRQRYEFELWAQNVQPNTYVAMGFSEDNFMGDDSVTECSLVNGRVGVFMSYNEGKENIRLREPSSGLNVLVTNYSDGNLYCRFERQAKFVIGDKTFDLTKPYMLILARGSATENGVSYHGRQKVISSRQINLAETRSVGASKGTLIKLHGSLMAIAWMFTVSCGILFARYFRLTWVGKQVMGKDIWFVAHQTLMTLSWLLTTIAFILIFIELGGWTSLPVTTNPHAVIGVVMTVLAVIQPIMAYFRPHPGTPKRFIFNWAHWLVGNSAHILGIVCIFLAVDLDKAAIPYWIKWLLVTYVAVYVTSHFILSWAQCFFHKDRSRNSETAFPMNGLATHQSSQNLFNPTQGDKNEDDHGSKFRRIMIFSYIPLAVCFVAVVVGVIVTGPWAKQ